MPSRIERYRAERHPFVAGIQVTAINTETQLAAHTEDLNLFGCFVETQTPFADGTKIRIRISHNGTIFTAQGRVAYSRDRAGMGIIFTSIEPSSVSVLDAWLTELTKWR